MTQSELVNSATNIVQTVLMGCFIGRFIRTPYRKLFIVLLTVVPVAANFAMYFNSTLQTFSVYVLYFALPLIFGKIQKPKIVLYLLIAFLLMNVVTTPSNLLLLRKYPEARAAADFPVEALLFVKAATFPLLAFAWFLSNRLCGRILRVEQSESLNRYLPFLLVETVAMGLIELNMTAVNENLYLLLACSGGVVGAMLIIDLLLMRTINQLNEAHSAQLELQQVQNLLRNQDETYAMMRSQLTALHRIRHDTANQLGAIAYQLETGNYDGAQQQLAAFRQTSDRLAAGHYTGNSTLDAVINVKLAGFDAENIRLDVDGTLPEQLTVDPAALCSVLSNLLDNAMHACEALEPGDEPAVISLKTGIRQNYLLIRCSNPCTPDTVAPDPEQQRHTFSEEAGSLHGWGTRILRQIAEQYNGSASFRVEDGQFIAEIQLGLSGEGNCGTGETKTGAAVGGKNNAQ